MKYNNLDETLYARDSITRKYFFPLYKDYIILTYIIIQYAITNYKSKDTNYTKFENIKDNSKNYLDLTKA